MASTNVGAWYIQPYRGFVLQITASVSSHSVLGAFSSLFTVYTATEQVTTYQGNCSQGEVFPVPSGLSFATFSRYARRSVGSLHSALPGSSSTLFVSSECMVYMPPSRSPADVLIIDHPPPNSPPLPPLGTGMSTQSAPSLIVEQPSPPHPGGAQNMWTYRVVSAATSTRPTTRAMRPSTRELPSRPCAQASGLQSRVPRIHSS